MGHRLFDRPGDPHLWSFMVRLSHLPEPFRSHLADLACPTFDTRPWVGGPAVEARRVAMERREAGIGAEAMAAAFESSRQPQKP